MLWYNLFSASSWCGGNISWSGSWAALGSEAAAPIGQPLRDSRATARGGFAQVRWKTSKVGDGLSWVAARKHLQVLACLARGALPNDDSKTSLDPPLPQTPDAKAKESKTTRLFSPSVASHSKMVHVNSWNVQLSLFAPRPRALGSLAPKMFSSLQMRSIRFVASIDIGAAVCIYRHLVTNMAN